MENIEQNPFENLEVPEIPDIENFDMAEWVFQFDDDEPIVIAWSNTEEDPGELSFILKPNSESSVIFKSKDGKKTLRLYSRLMPAEKREELKRLRESEENLKNNLDNISSQ